ncbi:MULTISPECIES: acyltransferase family protein [Rhizobium]|uniref:acyltransferase family protein n=1 Tax=Rhizobium TaxID=379 RepID=UPI00234F0D07|nr:MULTISPECIES: acyltransferase [unclassified Rhizobium]MDC7745118.1 acyltransferase [Rhizobium sp. BC56]MDC9811297.1 acyltransferase [Rhizobium sp. MC62]
MIPSGNNIEHALSDARGRPNGFDYLRIILSISVVIWHTMVTSYGPEAQDAAQASAWRPLITVILPMFFALSGFLVAGSLHRCETVISFLGLRVIRIYPALMAEVLLSAFIIGPLFTSFSLTDYYTSPVLHSYMWNLIGHVHFQLPGLFLQNPNPNQVNGQLWTIPWELYCYVTLGGMTVLGFARRRWLQVCASIALAIVLLAAFLYTKGFDFSQRMTAMPAFMLVLCFLAGVSLFQWRERIPYSKALFVTSAAIGLAGMSVPVYGDFIAILPLTYCTVYLGVSTFRKTPVLALADYSYGIFLYGYVVQQAWMSVDLAFHHWAINLALALPTTLLLAIASWHLIEKPAMKFLRPIVVSIEERFSQRPIRTAQAKP